MGTLVFCGGVLLSELTYTHTDIKNDMPLEYAINAQRLCYELLYPISDEFGSPKIHSAFRSKELNTHVGGALYSDHLKCLAVDVSVPGTDLDELEEWIRDNLEYRYIKKYPSHIHISLKSVY